MISFRRAVSREDAALIAQMDVICFPIDTPAEFAGANWFIGWAGDRPAAYCAWKVVEHDAPVGFHYRGGVMPDFFLSPPLPLSTIRSPFSSMSKRL